MCSTGAPQGTVLSPFLSILCISFFKYNSRPSHPQKYSVMVGCVSNRRWEVYRTPVDDLVKWSGRNHWVLIVNKTREMVTDFWRKRVAAQTVCPGPGYWCGRGIQAPGSWLSWKTKNRGCVQEGDGNSLSYGSADMCRTCAKHSSFFSGLLQIRHWTLKSYFTLGFLSIFD